MAAGPLKRPDLPEERKEMLRRFTVDFGGAPVIVAVLARPAETEIDKEEFPITAGVASKP